MGMWMQKWMAEYVVPNKRQQTVERYQGVIKKHITQCWVGSNCPR